MQGGGHLASCGATVPGWRSCGRPHSGAPPPPQTSRLWLLSPLKIPGAPTSVELKIQGHGEWDAWGNWSPHPLGLTVLPCLCLAYDSQRRQWGDVETKEDGEERYPGRTGKGRRKERCVRWQRAGGGGGSPSAAVDSSPGPGRVGVWAAEDNFCQQPAGSCPPPALRYAAPRPPSRGSRSPGRAVPHPGAHAPRPPASSPSGPEGATGQRGPESGPGCVGGGALLPRASCARGSAAPARAVAPSAAARPPGDRARAPGGSRAPSARGGEGGSGAGSRRKHPAT